MNFWRPVLSLLLLGFTSAAAAIERIPADTDLDECMRRLEARAGESRLAEVFKVGRSFRSHLDDDELDSIVVIGDIAEPDRSHRLTFNPVDRSPRPRTILGPKRAKHLMFVKLDAAAYAKYQHERVLRGIIHYRIERLAIEHDRRIKDDNLRPGLVFRIADQFFVVTETLPLDKTPRPLFWQSIETFKVAVFDQNPEPGRISDAIRRVNVGAYAIWTMDNRHVVENDIEVLGLAKVVATGSPDAPVTFAHWERVTAFDRDYVYQLNMSMFAPQPEDATPRL